MQEKSVITRTVEAAGGIYAPGHLGELTQIVDFVLVDAVIEETGSCEKRLRLLPSRVVVYFVLALALFEDCSYRGVWGKLTAGLQGLPLVRPAVSSLSRARRRIGAAPLRRLFEILAGPVAHLGQPGSFYRGLRTVSVDGTLLHVPDEEALTWRYPKRAGEVVEFGYPLLRLVVLVECGTRAVLAAAFGPESDGELTYAGRLLSVLDRTMLLLADAGFDANEFARDVQATGAQFLVRSSARRIPTPFRHLGDGSYLARIGYGVLPVLPVLLSVRVIEASVTITLADGTVRTEQWRLLTSLLDPAAHPAAGLVDLYHERWQSETTYFSIKATMLDGRVLRSRSLTGLDQEVYALLTTYQALIRAAADTACTRPGLDMDRISFTVLHTTAADTVATATGILLPAGPADLVGTIGRAALESLHPARHRHRVKARTRKNPTSKYGPNAGQHPTTSQNYTIHTVITFFEHGLANRSRK
ncbi:IS4 family transposase [Streptomyces mirabilis]|uniref:IS4 family transposase n=1 Tax=Streptomyces mirabilis TaxID=68239 RepID=UPI00225198ED|nr:IS4 family transposase [Streptomyces mirabilis]MCX4419431.1 IS4 family transposase [Streptomyces mirabilis]MCX4426954.1 IS4 family transposase [Streptomyces mirabilis]MCX4427781.1 IS4 family transposase [Streptomyces mirabilis]